MTIPPTIDATVAVDLTPFEGRWLNTADQAQWLQALSISLRNGAWQLHAFTVPEGDLGATPLTSYRDNMGGLAFKAEYQLADRRVSLAANTQVELIVLTIFHHHKPGLDRQNLAQREFFYRAETPDSVQ